MMLPPEHVWGICRSARCAARTINPPRSACTSDDRELAQAPTRLVDSRLMLPFFVAPVARQLKRLTA
eukprot:10552466-Alexandrium_andersonii.AAC.1